MPFSSTSDQTCQFKIQKSNFKTITGKNRGHRQLYDSQVVDCYIGGSYNHQCYVRPIASGSAKGKAARWLDVSQQAVRKQEYLILQCKNVCARSKLVTFESFAWKKCDHIYGTSAHFCWFFLQRHVGMGF